jgi:dTDP-4-dehydrorhamnose reductase
MKIFVSGARGALGREMTKLLTRQGIEHLATDIDELDVTDFKQAHDVLVEYHPDVILHFAAVSDVDKCEETPEDTLRVNALSSLGLGTIAKKINASILYTSTNFVFDGNDNTPYGEDSMPNPINRYGQSKLLGETYIRETCPHHFIIRTSWLFGRYSRNFISRFLNSDTKPKSLNAVCDRCASFTYTVDLAKALLTIITSDRYGVYHIVNRGEGSFMDFLLKAKELMNFNTELRPIKAADLNLPAPRPQYSPLSSHNYEDAFEQNMRHWPDALAEFVSSLPSVS